MIGQTLRSYQIIDQLGAGGMGRVYAATHTMLGNRAAIKVLLPKYSDNKSMVERFFREARAAGMINHAGIVKIFDYGFTDDRQAFIMMEYLHGESLAERLQKRGRLYEEETIRFTRQIASALSAAHAAGIIHRDLKPDNIFLTHDDAVEGGERVKVLDFGIAKLTADTMTGVSKTGTGTIMGSPLYMSPEQCEGAGHIDFRSDIYSLGCVMYHMVCGRPPFKGEGSGALIAQHICQEPRSPLTYAPSLSPQSEQVIMQALAKQPDQRFQSMTELSAALGGSVSGRFGSSIEHLRTSREYAVSPTMQVSSDHVPAQVAGPLSDAGLPGQPPPPVETVQAMPTTLAGVASQVTNLPASRRKKGGKLWLVLAAAVMAGAIAAAVIAGSSPSPDTGGQGVAAAANPAEPSDPAPGALESTRAGDGSRDRNDQAGIRPADRAADTPEVPAPPPEPETVTFTITSTPRGALVRDGRRKLLGETPYIIELPRDGADRTFILIKNGFVEESLTLAADRDHTRDIALKSAHKNTASARKSQKNKKKNKKHKTGDDDPIKKKKDGWGTTVDPLK